jgi:flagellar biosynthesis protein FlhF
MQIKRYVAASLEEAVARVKEELGPDALVLTTRRVRRDGGLFGWLGRPMVELVAGVDREARRSPASTPPMVDPHPSWEPLTITQALLDPLEAELRALRRDLETQRTVASASDVAGELAELRLAVTALAARADRVRDPLARKLIASGFAAPHARALADEAGARGPTDPRAALSAVLAARLDTRLVPPREDRARRVSLFVGGAGVGKTTTVAKLAGRAGAREGLALVSTDVHRAGGCEGLRAFARERGIPFATAPSPEAVIQELGRSRARRVLVDTTGEGRCDAAGLGALARLRTALGSQAGVHLVVSATTRAEEVREELRRFAPLAPDALVLTRMDDATRLGEVANLLLDRDAPPLAWLGTGRRVPEDLVLPDPERLARQLLGAAA